MENRSKDTSKKVALNIKNAFQALPAGSQAAANAQMAKKVPMKKSISIGALKKK